MSTEVERTAAKPTTAETTHPPLDPLDATVKIKDLITKALDERVLKWTIFAWAGF
jgi:hypothetical protein